MRAFNSLSLLTAVASAIFVSASPISASPIGVKTGPGASTSVLHNDAGAGTSGAVAALRRADVFGAEGDTPAQVSDGNVANDDLDNGVNVDPRAIKVTPVGVKTGPGVSTSILHNNGGAGTSGAVAALRRADSFGVEGETPAQVSDGNVANDDFNNGVGIDPRASMAIANVNDGLVRADGNVGSDDLDNDVNIDLRAIKVTPVGLKTGPGVSTSILHNNGGASTSGTVAALRRADAFGVEGETPAQVSDGNVANDDFNNGVGIDPRASTAIAINDLVRAGVSTSHTSRDITVSVTSVEGILLGLSTKLSKILAKINISTATIDVKVITSVIGEAKNAIADATASLKAVNVKQSRDVVENNGAVADDDHVAHVLAVVVSTALEVAAFAQVAVSPKSVLVIAPIVLQLGIAIGDLISHVSAVAGVRVITAVVSILGPFAPLIHSLKFTTVAVALGL